MNRIHVGVGEYRVSCNTDDVIKTFALGSCVAVIIYDRVKKIAGLIHIALPDSSINSNKAKHKPGYFADTGLPLFLEEMKRRGVRGSNVWIKITGGSNVMDEKHRFDIGKRNILAVKKFLWKKQLGIIAEDTGGNIGRTVSISVATGGVNISNGKREWIL